VERIDLVTLMFNYHDLGHLGVDRATMNKAVFRALKSGGLYVIADHSGRPGTGISESGTLHRIFGRKSKRPASSWWTKGSSYATRMIPEIRIRRTRRSQRTNSSSSSSSPETRHVAFGSCVTKRSRSKRLRVHPKGPSVPDHRH
jgi:predicted deacetylase